jgi:hypothetical protein
MYDLVKYDLKENPPSKLFPLITDYLITSYGNIIQNGKVPKEIIAIIALMPYFTKYQKPDALEIYLVHEFKSDYDAIKTTSKILLPFYVASKIFPNIIPIRKIYFDNLKDKNTILNIKSRGVLIYGIGK